MECLIFLIALLSVFYTIVIVSYTIGWYRLKVFTTSSNGPLTAVSVIIACRNEEKNIPGLIAALAKQDYPLEYLEILLVNDHSTDGTAQIIQQCIKNYRHMHLLELPAGKKGKKEAIALGIQDALFETVLTTDADCTMGKHWIKTMSAYHALYRPDLLSGPVSMGNRGNIFDKIQSLEFLSLISTGAGSIGIKRPVMCNGANLLFKKSLYNQTHIFTHYPSGDDIFLMLYAKKHSREKIHFVKSEDAIVHTRPTGSLFQFFNQRARWVSKSKGYRDFDIVSTAIIVALMNLSVASMIVYSIFDHSIFRAPLFLYLTKTIVDLLVLVPASLFFNKHRLLWLIFPVQVVYPFYIILSTLIGFWGNLNWKNRKLKEKL